MGKNRFFYITLAAILSTSCSSKNESEADEFMATETRDIDGHNVQITAGQYQRSGGNPENPVTYISYTVNVDGRGDVDDIGYVTPMQAATPKDALKILEIRFSKTGEHMQARVTTKGGYSTYFHFLKKGPPFRLIFKNAGDDPWLNMPLDELPAAQIMADSVVIGKKEGLLNLKSVTEFRNATKSGN